MKKYFVDYKQFETVRKPEVAYLLGLLWADGYLKPNYALRIKANREDLESLESVFNSVGTWGVYDYNPIGGRKPQRIIEITDKNLGQILENFGFLDKSHISACKMLNSIPDELKHYWFRGYFDGDGGICIYKKYPQVNFSGGYEQDFTFLFNQLNKLEIGFHYVQRKNDKSQSGAVTLNSRQGVKVFSDYIYQGKQFGLKRKKIKFETALKTENFQRNILYTFNSKSLTLAQWAKELNVPTTLLRYRLDQYKKGSSKWSLEKVFTTGRLR